MIVDSKQIGNARCTDVVKMTSLGRYELLPWQLETWRTLWILKLNRQCPAH